MSSKEVPKKQLFGTDGIRSQFGTYPLIPELVEKLGYVSAKILIRYRARWGHSKYTSVDNKKFFIARDTRSSGEQITQWLAAGITAAGIKVVDLNVFPTPGVSTVTRLRKVLGSAVISASHNPAIYNGIKFFAPDGTKLADEIEHQIEQQLVHTRYQLRNEQKSFHFHSGVFEYEYINFLQSTIPAGTSLTGKKIVIDCANGANYKLAQKVFTPLGAQINLIAVRPNGNNINHLCGSLHPAKLVRTVLQTRADLGFAFDGDGDRVIFVDQLGKVLDGDALLFLCTRNWKDKGKLKSNTVVLTPMSNLALTQACAKMNVKVHLVSVGDKYVWEGMNVTGAVLGGEPVGHIIFREFSPNGDGMLTALQVLALWAENKKSTFASLFTGFVKYPQVIFNVPVKFRRDLSTIPTISQYIDKLKSELRQSGRVLVRYSGTEPLIRIMIEGKNKNLISAYGKTLSAIVRQELG